MLKAIKAWYKKIKSKLITVEQNNIDIFILFDPLLNLYICFISSKLRIWCLKIKFFLSAWVTVSLSGDLLSWEALPLFRFLFSIDHIFAASTIFKTFLLGSHLTHLLHFPWVILRGTFALLSHTETDAFQMTVETFSFLPYLSYYA